MLRFDKVIDSFFLLKSILTVKLSNNLGRSDVLLFSEFTNIVSIFVLYFNYIEFNMLLYAFLVISFSRCKKYMTCLISFSKFSNVSLAFTCAGAILVFEPPV